MNELYYEEYNTKLQQKIKVYLYQKISFSENIQTKFRKIKMNFLISETFKRLSTRLIDNDKVIYNTSISTAFVLEHDIHTECKTEN